MKHKVNDLNHK